MIRDFYNFKRELPKKAVEYFNNSFRDPSKFVKGINGVKSFSV